MGRTRMLMWEDGFCRGRMANSLEEMDAAGEDPVRKVFSKMSIQLYNYGEGWVVGRLMGKVASDKCHKWVFKEPSECEQSISNHWQSSFDAVCFSHTHLHLQTHTHTLLFLLGLDLCNDLPV
ncbi:putative protein RICE SALT SENSITIVE 3 [Helianthus debilis subsp. tardiflorus]